MALPRLVASDKMSCSVIFVSVKLIFDDLFVILNMICRKLRIF